MKKVTILILVCLSTFLTRASDTTSITTKQVYEDVKAGFTKLVSNLEGPAKHTYGIFVNQQKAEAITSICICILWLVFSSILFFSYRNGTEWNSGWPDNATAVGRCIGGLFGFGSIIAFTVVMCQYLPQLINPEYYAIKDIVSMFK